VRLAQSADLPRAKQPSCVVVIVTGTLKNPFSNVAAPMSAATEVPNPPARRRGDRV